ncbi:MAG: hypothetical protein ABR520_07995 [Mycobacteriales bacterium]
MSEHEHEPAVEGDPTTGPSGGGEASVAAARERRDASSRLSTVSNVIGLVALLVGVPLLLLYRWWWLPTLLGLFVVVLGIAARDAAGPTGVNRGVAGAGVVIGRLAVVVGLFGLLGNGLG